MTIPVIDLSKLSEELLDRVKKVSSECYRLERQERFKTSTPAKLLNELIEKKCYNKLETVDWEDVFLLSDDNDWSSQTPGFRETMTEYKHELKKLAVQVMRSIASFYNPSYNATISLAKQLLKTLNKEVNTDYPEFVFGDYMSVYTEQKFLPKEPRFQAVKSK
ncbi:hypothetical protein POM88_022172 [Heracleum sosnowskyi]|uniref:Uncharacterized protein n=1 Tax=Heracleum sosnowskyi TaxID=360622 RepID=A0AAD8MTJ2_9APIA|nr:hypothetical protein POM88_022172 [Heracleum sosnowskyi]